MEKYASYPSLEGRCVLITGEHLADSAHASQPVPYRGDAIRLHLK